MLSSSGGGVDGVGDASSSISSADVVHHGADDVSRCVGGWCDVVWCESVGLGSGSVCVG